MGHVRWASIGESQDRSRVGIGCSRGLFETKVSDRSDLEDIIVIMINENRGVL